MNQQKPLVSVIIPVYNQSKLLRRALESAMTQTYERLEIIISDDYSTDNPKNEVGDLLNDKRVSYCRNDENIGRVKNYKKGLYELANGAWVLNLDGDDYYTDKNFISEAVKEVEKNKNLVFVQAGETRVSNSQSLVKLPKIETETATVRGDEYFLSFYQDYHFSHLGTMYNRQKAIEIGFYDNDNLSADIESLLKLSLLGDVCLIKKSVGIWSIHDSNISEVANLNERLNNLYFIDRVTKFAQEYIPTIKLKKWRADMTNFFFSIVVINKMSEGKRGSKYFKIIPLLFKRPGLMTRPYIIKTILNQNRK